MGWSDVARITGVATGGGKQVQPDFMQQSLKRRKANPGVFDPIGDTNPISRQPSVGSNWEPPTQRRSNSLSKEDFETPAMTDYLEYISNTPKREDYSPSIWRRVVAGLAGGSEGGSQGAMAGLKAAEEVNSIPYRHAMEDYETKGKGLEARAQLEGTRQKQRLDYLKYMSESEDKDLDRNIKIHDANTRDFVAETARKTAEFNYKIRTATNQVAVDRLKAEMEQWKAENELKGQQLGINRQNANTNSARQGSYSGYLSRLGTPKALPPSQVNAMRTTVEREVMNEHPNWLNANGTVDIQNHGPEYEAEVQNRLKIRLPRRQGDINLDNGLGGFFSMDDEPDNPYEQVQ